MNNKGLVYNVTMGSYYPTFLEMYLNTDKVFDLNDLNYEELSTFFHEWIHFLQDLTTSFGCYNAYVFFEHLLSMGHKVMDMGVGEIVPPVQIDNSKNVYTNYYLNKIGWGTCPSYIDFDCIIDCENIEVEIPQQYRSQDSPMKFPHCLVTTSNKEVFEFGALQVMESMAHLCQDFLFHLPENYHNAHPYLVATKVANYYSPAFAENPLNLIALCDVSLMCSVPGVQFVSYLERLRRREIALPKRPEEIYDFYLQNFNYLKSFTEIKNKARHHFKGILRDPNAFVHYHKWIDNAYNLAYKLRYENPYFLLNMLRKGDLYQNEDFKMLYKSFGTPLIQNNKGEYAKVPLDSESKGWDVEFMQPIKHLQNILDGGQKSCLLKEWCKKSEVELLKMGASAETICRVDERCDKNPSLRSLDKVRCPFGFVWYATGLPIVKSDC